MSPAPAKLLVFIFAPLRLRAFALFYPWLLPPPLLVGFAHASPTLRAEPPITAVCFAPGGTQVATGSQAGIKIVSWPDLKVGKSLATQLANVHDLAFSPDGKLLLAAGGAPGDKGELELFAWPSGELLRRFECGGDVVYAVAWKADGTTVASASGDGKARLHRIDDGGEIGSYDGHSRAVLAACFLPGDKQLVTASRDHSLRLWDVETRKSLRALDNHTGPATALALRPLNDENKAAPPMIASIGGDRTLRLWQPTIGRLVRFVKLPSEPLAVQWTADGERLAVTCADGRVRIVAADTVEILQDLPAVAAWAYSLARGPQADEFLIGGAGGELKRVTVASPSAK